MTRRFDMAALIAMALVAVVFVGVLTPICAMPTCEDVSAGACSDYKPACDKCPDAVVMKHTRDDATSAQTVAFQVPSVVSHLGPLTDIPVLALCSAAPVATASPPPLDPLGVRLTV